MSALLGLQESWLEMSGEGGRRRPLGNERFGEICEFDNAGLESYGGLVLSRLKSNPNIVQIQALSNMSHVR